MFVSFKIFSYICITSELGIVPTAKVGLATIRNGEDYLSVESR